MRTDSLTSLEELAALTGPRFQIFAMARPRKPAEPRQHADPLADLSTLASAARAIQDAASAEGRDLTPGEQVSVGRIFDAFEATEAVIDGTDDRRGTGRKTDPDDVYHGGLGRRASAGDEIRMSPQSPGVEGRRFKDLFAHIPIDGSQMPVVDFFQNIGKGVFDPRLLRNSQSESTGADGGFAVPPQFVSAVWDILIQQSVVLPRATIFPAASNSLTVPRPDLANRSVDVAGLASRWLAEGAEFSVDVAKLTQTSFRLNKLGILIKISNEWLEDVPPQNSNLFADLVAGVLAFDLDSSFFAGVGVGMPMGLIAAKSAVTVAKESGQAADTIEFPNVLNAWSRLHPQCQQNAVWFCSPSCLPQLALMQFSRSATNPVPVYLPAAAAAGQPFATLMGKPLIPTEFQPHVGDEGDLILTDLSKYGVCAKPAMQIDRSADRYFEEDAVAMRGKIRLDGRPLWSDVHVPRNDQTMTLSWCIRLATRA